MSKKALNQNIKVVIRVKPIQYPSEMVEITDEKMIKIKDVANSTETEEQRFIFDKIFPEHVNQENFFGYCFKNSITRALDGNNTCILSYGQTGAGKSYCIYGEDDHFTPDFFKIPMSSLDKRGLIPRTVDYLLNLNKELEGKELSLKCTFVEIYMEKVRDLSRAYIAANPKAAAYNQIKKAGTSTLSGHMSAENMYENDDLEVFEHPNGQMLIRNVNEVELRSLDDLYKLLQSAFQMRLKAEVKGSQLSTKSHTIFTLQIIQKDQDNENLPFPKSQIQFVDLAGSERTAKSIAEGGLSVQESVHITSSLNQLSKVLQGVAVNSKNISYRETKLTKVLYNCLGPYNSIMIVCNVNPAEANFQETKLTLQFGERCKNPDFKEKKFGPGLNEAYGEIALAAGNGANDRALKKLSEEIEEHKLKIETINKENKKRLEKLKQLVGLDIDFEKMSFHPSSKEVQWLTRLKDALIENDNLKETIEDLKEQIFIADRGREEEFLKASQSQKGLVTDMHKMREKGKKETEVLKTQQRKNEESLKQQIQKLMEENKKLVDDNKALMEEKMTPINNFHSQLNQRTRDVTLKEDQLMMARREIETQFKEEIAKLKEDNQKVQESLKSQYEGWLKQKNDDMEKYAREAKDYARNQKKTINELKSEVMELYTCVDKHSKLVDKIENGAFSGGIKSFFIPKQEKPTLPQRGSYPHLYKMLDDKKKMVSSQDVRSKYIPGKTYSNTGSQPYLNQPEEDKHDDDNFDMSKRSFVTSLTNKQSSTMNIDASKKEKGIEDQIDLKIEIEKLQGGDLRTYAENLKKACKNLINKSQEYKVNAEKYVQLNVYGDIHEIIEDRDRYKEMYKEEARRNKELKVATESQKRQLGQVQSMRSTATKVKVSHF